jgi:hypothetical protein
MHRISGPGGGPDRTDPDYAPTVEVFDNLAYEDICRGVAQLDPTVLTAGRQAWQGAASAVSEAVQQAHAEFHGAVAAGWRGRAASTAAGAVQAFEELGRHLSDVMAEVGHRLGQANDAAETLRAAIAQSPPGRPDLEGALLDPRRAVTNMAVQKAAEDTRQEAVRVMNTVYVGVFLPTGSGVPAFDDTGLYPPPGAAGPHGIASGGDGPASSSLAGAPAARPGTAPGATGPADRHRSAAAAENARTVGSLTAATPDAGGPAAGVPAVAPAAAGADPTLAALGRTSGTAAAQPVRAEPGTVVPPDAEFGAAGPARTRNADVPRDRENRDRRGGSGSAGAGLDGAAAGIIGGGLGGLGGAAFASGDLVRGGGAPRPLPFEEEDEDEFYDDDLTFLEPAEPGTDLVGEFDPTTPPVLGEWSGDE